MDNYTSFLAAKEAIEMPTGFDVPMDDINPASYGPRHQYQPLIVQWALKLGCAAIFAKYGLGKTRMQLEWANHVARLSGGQVLILAPLAVAQQTESEAAAFGLSCQYMRTADEINGSQFPVICTNYERLKGIDCSKFVGVVLDESSILKNYTGATKRLIFESFQSARYKLCCSATPSPNNYLELLNHSEFLGIEKCSQSIAKFFRNDTMKAGGYVLKAYAQDAFWQWVSSWAVCVTCPQDLGFDGEGWSVPDPQFHYHVVETDHTTAWSESDKHGQLSLLRTPSNSATSINKEGRLNADRIAKQIAAIVAEKPDEQWVIWCFTDYESDALQAAIPDAVDLRGSNKMADKEAKLEGFTAGSIRVLITKPKIAGMGLNWQHCANQCFVMGTSYSFEGMHQAMHRLIRFGQQRQVNTHFVYPETAGSVRAIFQVKENQHDEMQRQLIANVARWGLSGGQRRNIDDYNPSVEMALPDWLVA